jgi:hypothetical protein
MLNIEADMAVVGMEAVVIIIITEAVAEAADGLLPC